MRDHGRPLGVGVIGCGAVATGRHLPTLAGTPGLRVTALADVDPERLRAAGVRFAITRRHARYQDLLEDSAVEVVAVCVPPVLHREIAAAALTAGRHVLIEKPLALTLDDGEHLIEHARACRGLATVGFHNRWHRLIRRARDFVRRGDLGRVHLLRTAFTSGMRQRPDPPGWLGHRSSGGGALVETGSHHVDLWRFLLDDEIQEVSAVTRSVEGWDDEAALLSARMESGVLAGASLSQNTADGFEIEICGEAALLRVSGYRLLGLELTPARRRGRAMPSRLAALVDEAAGLRRLWDVRRQGGDYLAAFRAQWQHFRRAIRGEETLETTLDDGQRALQAVLTATESVTLGRAVRVSEGPRGIVPATGPTAGSSGVAPSPPRHV